MPRSLPRAAVCTAPERSVGAGASRPTLCACGCGQAVSQESVEKRGARFATDACRSRLWRRENLTRKSKPAEPDPSVAAMVAALLSIAPDTLKEDPR